MRRLRWGATLAAQAGAHRLLAAAAAGAGGHAAATAGDGELNPSQRLAFMAISVGLVVTAGLMSGLTLGLMSMDLVELEVLRRSGTSREQQYAAAIAPIVSNQHFLLVTLLLCNAVAMEALPLFLDRLADPVTAILISVTAVLLFGEILPQAVCSRYGLAIGYYCAWLVRVLMAATSPISWPIGKLLDFLLGAEHRALFRRGQLKALVDIHGADEGLGGNLTEDEIKVICGALDLTSKTARKSMTPLNKVFMLPADARLNQQTMRAILASGHSRIPVYTRGDRSSIIGLILVKELLQYKTHQEVPVSEVRMRSLPRLPADTPMYDMLKLFQTGRSHMVVLTDTPATARAAAAAALRAKAAADAADAESGSGGSDSGSEHSSGGSPLASMLRKRGGKKKKKQFESPLLQPIEIPPEQLEHEAAAPQQEQQQQPQMPPGAVFFSSSPLPISNGHHPHEEQQQQQQPTELAGRCSSDSAAAAPRLQRSNRSSSSGAEARSRGRVSFREHGAPSEEAVAAGTRATQPPPPQQQQLEQQQPAEQDISSRHQVLQQQGDGSWQHADSSSEGHGGAAAAAAAAGGPSSRNNSSGGGSGGSGSGRGLHTRSKSGPMLLSLAIGHEGEQHTDALSGPEGVAVPIGIITIEDVIEELMQAEIVDETDLYVDNERSITVNAAALAQGLPAQLRQHLALQSPQHAGGAAGVPVGALAGAAGAAGAVRKMFRQKSVTGLSAAAAAGGAGGQPQGQGGIRLPQAAQGPGGSASSSSSAPAVAPGGPFVEAGGAAGGGPVAAGSSGAFVAAVSSGLAAAAAAATARTGGAERQPLLSPSDRAAPSSHG